MSVLDMEISEIDGLLKVDAKADSKSAAVNVKEAEALLKTVRTGVNLEPDKTKKAAYQLKIKGFEAQIAAARKNQLIEPERERTPQSKNEKEDAGLAMLEAAHAQLLDTEQVGVGILQNLDKQKPVIQRSLDNLKLAHDKVKRGGELVDQMSKPWRG